MPAPSRRVHAFALTLCLVGVAALPACTAEAPRGAERPGQPGQPVPRITGKSLDRETVQLEDFYKPEGRAPRIMLLNVWATWCTPCRDELPELQRLHDRHEDLVVVGVSVDAERDEREVRALVSGLGLRFPIVLDPKQRATARLGLFGYPASFIIDRSGTIVWRRDGIIKPDDPEVAAALERARAAG
ncbi:MAG: TlpA family protein disulfide reductase [Myxococcales bacterium]|nr:TlpA family protein disulfide reductase [Myxococcales bacterium]